MLIRGEVYDGPSICDIYGKDLTDIEVMQKLDGEWLAMADVHVNWVAKSGRFAIKRSKYNDRGDAASTAARQKAH